MTNSLTTTIHPTLQWLLDRKISYELLQTIGVSVNDEGKVVIPVRDENGKIIFNKYRRNPSEDSGPKYTYDAGSKSSLFNLHTITTIRNQDIFITEGELDALLLNSLGLNAVSSTGGAGTFKPEWGTYFMGNNTYIVFDRDEAGIRGALRVQQIIPEAKIIFLPEKMEGKDVTDFFQKHTMKEFEQLAKESRSWYISGEVSSVPKSKTVIKKLIAGVTAEIDALMATQRDYLAQGKNDFHIELLKNELLGRLEQWKKILANYGKTVSKDFSERVLNAKRVPISNYLKFNSAGFAKCIFHNDDSPSLKIYQDNHVFCFGCSRYADTIDVVQEINKCSFKEAVDLIVGRT